MKNCEVTFTVSLGVEWSGKKRETKERKRNLGKPRVLHLRKHSTTALPDKCGMMRFSKADQLSMLK